MRRISNAVRVTIIALSALSLASGAHAEVMDKTATIDGTVVEYLVVLPNQFDPAKTYPAILAFPPGGQEMDLVGGMVQVNFQDEAERRGYIVIAPAAPGGDLFVRGGQKIFPAFLTKLLADYKIQGNKFNAAGISNGGLSAFLIASKYPDYFQSVTGFPGYLGNNSPQEVAALGKLCIHMYAGERDTRWADEEREQFAGSKAAGYSVTFSVESDEGHVMRTLAGPGSARLFDQFDAARKGHCAK